MKPGDADEEKRSEPFSRPFVVDEVPDEGMQTKIAATPVEDAAIAVALGLPAVSGVVANLRLHWQPGRRLVVTGEVTARITQICVVSLDPFESDAAQEIDLTFVETKAPRTTRAQRPRDARGAARRQAIEAAPSPAGPPADAEDDPPDPIVDGRIDLGIIAVEFLTLALDFYPKKPGVAFHDVVIGEADDRKPSAFAVLERLKDRS